MSVQSTYNRDATHAVVRSLRPRAEQIAQALAQVRGKATGKKKTPAREPWSPENQ